MTILGIDPGKTSGAICLMDQSGLVIDCRVMPETSMLCDLLESWTCDHGKIKAFIEKAQTMPGQGGVSTFRYGQHYGSLEGVLICLNISHQAVHPATWTKVMHAGCSKKEKGRKAAKARSLEAARRIWPRKSFIATERSRVPHDGIIDAMLIAEYGRRFGLSN